MAGDAGGYAVRVAPWRLLVFFVLPATACTPAADLMRQESFWPVWPGLAFLLVLLVGAIAVGIQYGRRLAQWDLSDSAVDPGVGQGFTIWSIVVGIVFGGVPFTIVSFMIEAIDPAQQWLNVILWWLGGISGGVGAWFLGRWIAARDFR